MEGNYEIAYKVSCFKDYKNKIDIFFKGASI